MTAIGTTAPRFDIGRVVNRTIGALGRNLAVFALISILFGAIPYGTLQWFQLRAVQANDPFAGVAAGLLAIFVNLFSSCMIQAAITHGAIADLNGRKASFGESLSTGLRSMFPVLAIGLLMGLGVMVGLVLFIIPGVLLVLAWAVVIPVEVVERGDVFASFTRSAELTRNNRGALFALFVLYWVLTSIVLMVLGLVVGLGGYRSLELPVLMAVITTVAQSVTTLIGAVGLAVVYYELRSIKEGVGPEALAAVFD
jgi:hypothetical protein